MAALPTRMRQGDDTIASRRSAPQGRGGGRLRALAVVFAAVAAGATLCACSRGAKTAAVPSTAARLGPSGLPVPRYVSLKFGKVNARAGPGEDYKALWTYSVKGLPLQVVAETDDWRRVCDPYGALSWVKKSGVSDSVNTVMRTAAQDLALHREPSEESPESAALVAHAIADLKQCRGDGWCRISVGRASGWIQAGEVWGAADAPQCH